MNNEIMQKQTMGNGAWIESEFGLAMGIPIGRGIVPWLSRNQVRRWFHEILAAQVKYQKPDVLLNLAMEGTDSCFLQGMKPYTRLLVGQIAAPLPQGENWGIYDLVISSLPNFVEYFRSLGIHSKFNRLARLN